MKKQISGGGLVLLALVLLVACSKQATPPPAPVAGPSPPPPQQTEQFASAPPKASPINIAAADMGGAVEELTDNYGPGFTGRRLVDGLLTPTWKLEASAQITYPQEAVISFFERELAEIDSVQVVLTDPATNAPSDVEVWTSSTSPTEGFTRRATATLEAKPGEQTVAFEPVQAKFVKLRILSGASPQALEVAEVRVLESKRPDYTPLFVRAPMAKQWRGSPREGAQRGLDWLQQAAPDWKKKNGSCFGCHVQSQVLMGQAVAKKHEYRVNPRSVVELDRQIRSQASYGSWFGGSHAAVVFGSMGLAYAAEALGLTTDKGRSNPAYPQYSELDQTALRLLERQGPDGSLPIDEVNPPIIQGQFMTTANALVAVAHVAAQSDDPKYGRFMERALAWIATNEPQTTQDKVFKIIALMHHGTPDQKRVAWSVVETLAAEQEADGGWKESADVDESNAFATGQVLYAFKQAGVSIHGDMFRRGVDFLLRHQEKDPASLENGSWAAMHTASKQPTRFAPTMWAVIGLAGAYGAEPTGALQIVKQEGNRPPARNLAIVLDVSGSMNAKLGGTTRWATALATLDEVVDALPDDLNVGLRVYGHRHSSKSAQTCKDTELVVPVAKLDRDRIRTAAARLKPRGETPLIHSVLQAVQDLKAAGGGSIVLITDGEESCRGSAKDASAQIASSGVGVTLNIVGFTLTGEAVQAELGGLAGATGGHYYSAHDGGQLSRAVKLAALQRLAYDLFDASGKLIVSGQTSELSRELPPGNYRIRVDALGQVLEEAATILPNETTRLALGVEGERFTLRRGSPPP